MKDYCKKVYLKIKKLYGLFKLIKSVDFFKFNAISKNIYMIFLIVSKLLFIIIILLQTIFLLRSNRLAKVWSTLTIPIIVFSLQTRLEKGMTLTLTKKHLMLSKNKDYTQYLGII